MIIDHLQKASLYTGLGERIALAFRVLQSDQLLGAEPGRYELQGSDVYALVQHYETKPREAGRWEAHRRYIDVQCVVSGTELMGRAPLDSLTVSVPYNEEKDILYLTGKGDFFTVGAGMFALFFPHDAHMPTLAVAAPEAVHKIVVKVRAS